MKKAFYIHKYRFILIPLMIATFLAFISFVVMQLWNHLMPDILHVGTITFWQAMGIFILSKILFGIGKPGGGRFGGNPWMGHRMKERLKNMSPEDLSRFKKHFNDRMCHGRWRDFDTMTTDDTKRPDEQAD